MVCAIIPYTYIQALETGPAEAAPEAATATGLQDDTAVLVSEDIYMGI